MLDGDDNMIFLKREEDRLDLGYCTIYVFDY